MFWLAGDMWDTACYQLVLTQQRWLATYIRVSQLGWLYGVIKQMCENTLSSKAVHVPELLSVQWNASPSKPHLIESLPVFLCISMYKRALAWSYSNASMSGRVQMNSAGGVSRMVCEISCPGKQWAVVYSIVIRLLNFISFQVHLHSCNNVQAEV